MKFFAEGLNVVFDLNDLSITKKTIELIMLKNLRITSAESCTGGLFSKMITDVEGVSRIFGGSVCTYSNYHKNKILNVKNETLKTHGAVSSNVAQEMAFGASLLFGADISVAFTGYAGMSPDNCFQSDGLIFVCVLYNGSFYTESLKGFVSRETSRRNACLLAFNMVYKIIS